MKHISLKSVGLLLVLLTGSGVWGEETVLSPEEVAFFETKIRPVLVKHCYECHSAEAKEVGGKLLIDSNSGMRKGGESGPSLIAGQPDASLIIQALRYENFEMPPDKPLPEAVINDFVTWVSRGAIDPRTEAKKVDRQESVDRENLWSFFPRSQPAIPTVMDPSWSYDPLDQFVLSRLETEALEPVPDASPQVLVKRLYYDLTGLPPTFEELNSFAEDFSQSGQQAVERLVDELLNRPQYGERWGRHWLDVARFGESNGNDGLGRNATFPHAWRYRDYVIAAFNADLPYHRFLTEQIAGDLLPAETAEQRNRQLIATGFLAIGSKPAAAMNTNFAMDIVDDQINAVCTAVMGLSVACARCHDHKHDPIPTRDYYALAGIFSSTETLYGLAANQKLTAPPTELHQLQRDWDPHAKSQPSRTESPRFPADYTATVLNLQPDLHATLSSAPERLQVTSAVTFSDENYAQVKSATLQGQFPESGTSYSISMWFKNETKNESRPITAYLFSRAKLGDKQLPGDHLGIGGNHDKSRAGKLFLFNGNTQKTSLAGTTIIPEGTWNHVVVVRDGDQVRVHLNGVAEPEIAGTLAATFGNTLEFCLANRSDDFAPLDGNLAEVAIFSRGLSVEEAIAIHQASGQPRGARPPLGLSMGVREVKEPGDCKIHINGDKAKLGPSVPRGILSAYNQFATEPAIASSLSQLPPEITIPAEQSGRLELAAWLTHPDHPQTARVMINRIWLHLFGRGLVSTPDDFGVYGSRPTHPELLDHLAERFVEENWSIKRMIRTIVLSRTYQLASSAPDSLVQKDPENTLYGRHSRRRLDAESLRDSMLQVSGALNLTPAVGSPISEIDVLINTDEGAANKLHQPSHHRSIYLCLLRHAPPAELAAFDFPDGVAIVSQRQETTLPTQSLYLLNNPFVIAQAQFLANRLLDEYADDDTLRVQSLFRKILLRDPTTLEIEQSLQFLQQAASNIADSLEEPRLPAWTSLCQALLTTNEFRYLD